MARDIIHPKSGTPPKAPLSPAVRTGNLVFVSGTPAFYGDRSGSLKDPFGYTWHVATHRKDVSPGDIRNHSSPIAYP